MSLDDDIAFLEKVPTLALLGRQALRILAIGAEARNVPSGAVLFYAGDLADGGYVVQQGSFLLEADRFGKNTEEGLAGPGALLGELGLITDTVRTVTATAQQPSVVIRIPRSLFLKMLEGYPEAARSLREAMAARVGDWAAGLAGVKAKLESGLNKEPDRTN
jgi:CRP-like cAMP-binding protein